MKYKCVIFDCDGVLVDSEEITNKILVEMTNDLGGNIDLDYAYAHFHGKSLATILNHIESLTKKVIPDQFESDFRARTFSRFKSEIKPISGIEAVLKALTVPFCVASSGPRNKIELNLTTTKLLPYFQTNIFSSYDIGSWKPDPGIFINAAQSMGFEPAECIVIEDSISGVQAAIAGGFEVFGFASQKKENPFGTFRIPVFHNMKDLIQLLNQQ